MTEYTTYTESAPRPGRIPAGEPQECIANSINTARDYGLRYAEGIALSATVGIWYRHAWNLDAAGRVIDVTWKQPGTSYIGREIPIADKWAATVAREVYEFEDDCPDVPEGQIGMGCYTKRQRDWIEALVRGT